MPSVELTPSAIDDLRDLFWFLKGSYHAFGDAPPDATRKAQAAVRTSRDEVIRRLSVQAFQGTTHDELLPGLRHVTIGKTVAWFVASDDGTRVRILGLFRSGQDHAMRMDARLG